MGLPPALAAQFRIPLIAAPKTGVSGIDLVAAATVAGIGGSFRAHNAGASIDFDRWLSELNDARLGFDDLMRSIAHRQWHKGRGPERQLPPVIMVIYVSVRSFR